MAEQPNVHWVKYRPLAYLSSEARTNYTLAERGLLAELQNLNRAHGSVSASSSVLAKLLYVTNPVFKRAATRVLKEFVPDGHGRLTHPMVEAELAEASAYMERQRKNGKQGGRPRKPTGNPRDSRGKPTANPRGNPDETYNNQQLTDNQQPAEAETNTDDTAATAASGVPDEEGEGEKPKRPWRRWPHAMRAANRFPLMSAKVEARIQAEVLKTTPEAVTDESLTDAIQEDAGHLLALEKPNPVLYVMKLCDVIIEREAVNQQTPKPETEGFMSDAFNPQVRMWSKQKSSKRYRQCGCGSSVWWNYSEDESVCAKCCSPIDTILRVKVADALRQEAAGVTAEQRMRQAS